MIGFSKKLFCYFWRILRFIREFILNIFVLLLLIFLIGGFFASKSLNNKQNELKKDSFDYSVVVLNISGSINENPNPMSINFLRSLTRFGFNNNLTENNVFDIVEIIEAAMQDPKIKGLILDLEKMEAVSLPTLRFIGKYLNEFKSKGKPIYAIGQNFSQSQYYLASFANQIYLQPEGSVDVFGMQANALFFKDLLDKLDVKTHVFRVGTYKSAVEPFMLNQMSSDAKQNLSRWVNLMWEHYLSDIAKNRNKSPLDLVPSENEILTKMQKVSGNFAKYATENHFVDRVITRTDFWDLMQNQFNQKVLDNNENFLGFYHYFDKINHGKTGSLKVRETKAENEIALIFAEGSIVNEASSITDLDLKTLFEQIKRARLDPKIKAVVLRVNSPGGSVTASELIRNELLALKKTGKKLVVSMSDIAASGGYWISTPADKIVASQDTITGSIGVFGVISTVEQTLAKAGIHTDGISTSSLAQPTITRDLSPEYSQISQLSVENVYSNFLNLVASSRKKSKDEINQIAQGQVWLGTDALEKGLVDSLGDIDDAIDIAAQLANLEEYQLNWLETEKSWIEKWLLSISRDLQGTILSVIIPASILEKLSFLNDSSLLLNHFDDPKNTYIYCLNCAKVN